MVICRGGKFFVFTEKQCSFMGFASRDGEAKFVFMYDSYILADVSDGLKCII